MALGDRLDGVAFRRVVQDLTEKIVTATFSVKFLNRVFR